MKRYSIEELMMGGGDNIPEPEIDYSAPPTDIPGPFGDFLRDVRKSTPGFQSSKDAEKHRNLALEMAIAFGEADKLNKYLALHDRDLEDLKIKAKKMKINDFRNAINSAFDKVQNLGESQNQGSLALGYIKNLLTEYGSFCYKVEPFAFTMILEDGKVMYKTSRVQREITDIDSVSTMEMLKTFKDDLFLC